MTISTAVALVLALLSTTITNPAYLLLDEPVPSGAFGGVRVLAFAAVTAGAFLLARPEMLQLRIRLPDALAELSGQAA